MEWRRALRKGGTMEISVADEALLELFTVSKKEDSIVHCRIPKKLECLASSWVFSPKQEIN